MTNNDELALKLEQIEWLHGAAEEAAAVNLKMTMKPEEILQITSMLLALLAERDADKNQIAELEAREETLRPVGVMSEKAFYRLERSESRFIALWPRPGIHLPRKRPDDGLIVYARTAAGIKVEMEEV